MANRLRILLTIMVMMVVVVADDHLKSRLPWLENHDARSSGIIHITVTVTPKFVSTRNNLTTFECVAKTCRHVRLQSPLFTWQLRFQKYLQVADGECDQSRNVCRRQLTVDVGLLGRQAHDTEDWNIPIHCSVTDFVAISNEPVKHQLVTGVATANVRHFPGKRINERCSVPGGHGECGENMNCNKRGRCECPYDGRVVNYNRQTYYQPSTLIVVNDQIYNEAVCVPTRSLNESCHYDQQCVAVNPESFCLPLYDYHGFPLKVWQCQCRFGLENRGECLVRSQEGDFDDRFSKTKTNRFETETVRLLDLILIVIILSIVIIITRVSCIIFRRPVRLGNRNKFPSVPVLY